MKVILYMATSVNGYIAQLDHNTPWTKEEFASYSQKVKECGNLIIGKTTHDLMQEENAFTELGEPLVVVVTSSNEKPVRDKTVFVASFKDAFNLLRQKEFQTALVGGGGKLDVAALESGLLEEIFIDVEPWIFGNGIPLFSPSQTNLNLKLISTKKIGESGFQLHYQV